MMKWLIGSLFFLFCLTACSQSDSIASEPITKVSNPLSDSLAIAYFGSGCFWCVESIYESVNGVYEVESGYAGGTVKNPTYEQVCSGRTGHAETVKVSYNPKIISYEQLVLVFFSSHDPTTFHQQGPDKGSQYRSVIFYQTPTEKEIAQNMMQQLLAERIFPNITTELVPFQTFYPAESYHQNYECRNPYSSYVQNVSLPRLERFKKAMPQLLKNP
jgi:peptide-methionine (S)-S-oxide reductase